MTLHYLQQRGVIPVLQEIGLEEKQERVIDGWETWFYSDLTNLHKYWTPTNHESVGELFLGFFRYYSEQFKFEEYVVCCRQSALLKRIDKMWTGRKLAIEGIINFTINLIINFTINLIINFTINLILNKNFVFQIHFCCLTIWVLESMIRWLISSKQQ